MTGHVLADAQTSFTGWYVGFGIGVLIVLVVVALVTPILVHARAIGKQAAAIDDSLGQSVQNTAALAELRTTIDHAQVIVAGLNRGRTKLGG
jgi:hypothetical protein